MRARAAKKTINGFRSSKRSGHSGARGREVDSMREAKEDGDDLASIPHCRGGAPSPPPRDQRKDLEAASERNEKPQS